MFHRKTSALALVGVLASTTLALGPATATTSWKSCTAGGDTLSTGLTWFLPDSSTVRVTKQAMTITGNNNTQNNITAQFKHIAGTPVYWSWIRGDIKGGVTYEPRVDKYVPQSSYPFMENDAVFDVFGPDPTCQTLYVFQ